MARKPIIIPSLVIMGLCGGLAQQASALESSPSTPQNQELLELPSAPVDTPSATPAASTPSLPAVTASPAPTPPLSPTTPPLPATTARTPALTAPVLQAPAANTAPSLPPQLSPVKPLMASPPATPPTLPKPADDAISKNPDVLFEPLHLGNTSMMYNSSDMSLIIQALEVYDNSHTQRAESSTGKEDLSSLLDSLKSKSDGTPQDTLNAPLPNIYLGTILYYSPGHWSVWINGKKLVNRTNMPTNEFYIDRMSRSQVELIWKPASLQDIPAHWQQETDSGAHPIAGIAVDESKGTITLQMKPNQTFLTRSLAIREGFIKSIASTALAGSSAASANTPTAPGPGGSGIGLPPSDPNARRPMFGLSSTPGPIR